MSPRLPLLTLLAVLSGAGAGMAQDTGNLAQGFKACMAAAGDPDAISAAFGDAGWTAEPNAEEGLIYFAAPGDDQTLAYIADNGSFCHVESLNTDSATVSELLATTLQSEGWAADYGKNSDGCTQLDLGDSITATITSGGNDPTCGSDTDGAVRFEYGTEE